MLPIAQSRNYCHFEYPFYEEHIKSLVIPVFIRRKMESIHLKDEFIKLGQALKLAGLVGSGVDAKFVIQDGLVKVNGEVETQRGKKLYPGDTVSYDGKTFKVEN